jgi:iron complex transport system substrate-binding protein
MRRWCYSPAPGGRQAIPHPTLPLKAGRTLTPRRIPSPLRGRVGGAPRIVHAFILLGLALSLFGSIERVRAEEAKRIVSIGGSVTEIVYLLGAGESLVAVDSTSRYPEAAHELPNVGYMRQLAAEPILALQPSLVLAVEESGPPAVLAQLRAAGIPLTVVPDPPSIDGVLEKITTVAAALGREAEGRRLRDAMEGQLRTLSTAVAGAPERPSVLFLLSVGTGAPLAAGRDTAADGIIALAGGRNAIDGFDGYKPLSAEAVVAAAPEVILWTSYGLELLGGEEGLLRLPAIAQTPAARNHKIFAFDSLLLLGFGPRTGTAIRQLAERLHPTLQLPAEVDAP